MPISVMLPADIGLYTHIYKPKQKRKLEFATLKQHDKECMCTCKEIVPELHQHINNTALANKIVEWL